MFFGGKCTTDFLQYICFFIIFVPQVHTAVSRVVEYLERTTGLKYPQVDTIRQGYFHFEALTEHEYQFTCVDCGDDPSVVIMDLHRKGAFHLSGKNAFMG